ncbi:MAG: hypothetical protein JXA82_06205 [Sedimentisphaerales bacterium]|nr:hypothetical protein [Sedimentisphaerales bacterium]
MKTGYKRILIGFLVLAGIVVGWLLSRPAMEFEIIDLPPVMKHPRAINDHGQVVGAGYVVGALHALLWDPKEGLRDLGGFNAFEAWAVDINNNGQILIRARHTDKRNFAYFWDNGQIVNLNEQVRLTGDQTEELITSLQPGVYPLAMNDLGQVTGRLEITRGLDQAFLWDTRNGIQRLGTLGGNNSHSYDINNKGQIVGFSNTNGGANHAFLWQSGQGMVDLGSMTKSVTIDRGVQSINNHGLILFCESDLQGNEFSGILNSTKQPPVLMKCAGHPLQINDKGQILGYRVRERAFDDPWFDYFMEDPEKGRVYLNRFAPHGWRFIRPSMNNRGWVVGIFVNEDKYQQRPVILIPNGEKVDF